MVDKYNAKSNSVDDKQFVPHFSTWLNSEGWTEELITEKKEEFKVDNRNPFANLSLWKKGIRTMNDSDQDIKKAYKEWFVRKNSYRKIKY